MHETGPFSIPAIRDFVPPKLRPWIIIAFVIVFQFSGGLYLAAVSEMVGSTALIQEDIMMAGYASMIGMGLTFAIMFRLKFRFASKTSLMTCSIALIVSNLICMQTHSIPVLVITCFLQESSACGLRSNVILPFSYGLPLNGICRCFSVLSICWYRVVFSCRD